MRSRSAMSMLEVLVASAALATGVFSVFGAMGTSSQVRHRAKAQGLAVEAIQTQIERLQAMSFTNVGSSVPHGAVLAFDVPGLAPPKGQVDAGSIQREADSTSSRIHLRFIVDWTDLGGQASVNIHYHHVNRGG